MDLISQLGSMEKWKKWFRVIAVLFLELHFFFLK